MPRIAQTETGRIGLQAMAALSARDMEDLRALFAPDGAVEWPFAGASGMMIQGVDAIMRAFSPLAMFAAFVFTVTALYEMPDRDVVVIEGHSRGTLTDGRADYVNRDVFVLTIVGRQITNWREYFNPIEGGRVFGKVNSRAS